MNGISGPMIDRLGTTLGYAICIAWWSAAATLHALPRGPLSLGVFRFLLGMGEAGNWPAGVKVVAEWFPSSERALASGMFNSGSAIGAIIAPPLVAWTILRHGWPSAFLIVGAAGFVWLLIWTLVYHTPAQVNTELTKPPISVRRLLRTRWVLQFTLSKVFSDPVWYFGGAFAAVLLLRGVPVVWTRTVTVMFFAILMTSAIPAVLVPNVFVSIALISTATLGHTRALSNMLAMPADHFPKNTVGSIWGVASMGSGFGGMIFGLLTGWVVDHY